MEQKTRKMNKIRLLGILIIISSAYVQYSSQENEYSFLLGVITAIGIILLVAGRFNIFKKKRDSN